MRNSPNAGRAGGPSSVFSEGGIAIRVRAPHPSSLRPLPSADPFSAMNWRQGPRRRPGPGAAGFVAAILLAMAWNLSWGSYGLGAPATIQLTAREWLYEPREVSSSPGDVTFEVKNGGAIEHNFVVEDRAKKKRAEIPYIEPGQTLEATATLQPGMYTIYCGLPGHRDVGMIATLRVH
jgi:uncharacterized cupredoxin-like copper-binding protein